MKSYFKGYPKFCLGRILTNPEISKQKFLKLSPPSLSSFSSLTIFIQQIRYQSNDRMDACTNITLPTPKLEKDYTTWSIHLEVMLKCIIQSLECCKE